MAQRVATCLALFLATCVAGSSRADSTICAVGRLVETGDPAFRVLEHCGSPSYRTGYDAQGRRGFPVTHIEEWVYDLGPGSFLRLLHFENDVLVWIRLFHR
jgi:hypothetical protein